MRHLKGIFLTFSQSREVRDEEVFNAFKEATNLILQKKNDYCSERGTFKIEIVEIKFLVVDISTFFLFFCW